MIPTSDPHIFIEETRSGYTRYRRVSDGRRWEVHGYCDRRGDCLIGAVIDGEVVRDHEHLRKMVKRKGRSRIDSEMDVPVTPEFEGVCCPFTYTELDWAPRDDLTWMPHE